MIRLKKSFFIAAAVAIALSASLQSTQAQSPPKLPNDAAVMLPTLSREIDRYWSDLQPREFVPALIEQESLFKVKALLRTEREEGCGLGQFTRAYARDGTLRFDALEEAKQLDRSLWEWTWKDCANAKYQLRAVVLTLRKNDRACSAFMLNSINAKACAAAQYNGGAGSISKRIRACRLDLNCKPNEWFGNLELKCPQSRVKVAGYGEDFCTINSKYPKRVFDRMPKYRGLIQ